MSQSFTIEKVAGGFTFTEGPVWMSASSTLIFSDIPASKIYRYRDGVVDVWRDPSANANGNTLDRQGRLITCEHGNRRVSRTEPNGVVTTLADRYHGKRLNSPNDVVVDCRGHVYFTDPPYGVAPALRELDFQGVYRLDAGTDQPDEPELLVSDFVKPNGLAFSADGAVLYIADTELNHVRVFQVGDDGRLENGRVFCQVARPDGMRVDVEERLYVAAQTAVEVFDARGVKEFEIRIPERPANLAFGDADRRSLYVTAQTSLYRVRVPAVGSAHC